MNLKTIDNFIDGAFCTSSRTFEKRSPVNNQVIAHVAEASMADVDRAVTAGHQALKNGWGKLPIAERADLLYAVAHEINQRFDDFVAAETADTGMPASVARHAFVPRGAANFKIFADTIKNVPTETYDMATPDNRGALNYSIRRPVGVVGVICPWNAPLLLMTWKVAPALACGNAVVVKPSEESPQSASLLGEVMNTVGIPRGVYNVVNGFGPNSAGEFVTSHPGINAITFTGETRTGEAISKAAAVGARPVSLEMGGKNAGIIFADCDLDAAIEGTLRSAFVNTGQVCLGTERLYVERPLFERFVTRLKTATEAMKIGAPFDPDVAMGPMISQEQRSKVLSYYQKAQEEGATVITGGGIPAMPDNYSQGAWVQPTIWTGLPETARVLQEEIFGPCCHITPFDCEEEVLALANDTTYGLSATLWTTNLSRAHRMASELEAGIIWVNSWFLRDLRTPFGGMKQSGIGREGGVHSLEFYTELKNICIKL